MRANEKKHLLILFHIRRCHVKPSVCIGQTLSTETQKLIHVGKGSSGLSAVVGTGSEDVSSVVYPDITIILGSDNQSGIRQLTNFYILSEKSIAMQHTTKYLLECDKYCERT